MDEKLSDHGLDHPFFIRALIHVAVVLVFSIFTTNAFATSFGAIPLVEQVEHAPYALRGYIENRYVEMDRASNRPYTYWKFRVEEQLNGPSVASNITLRQPGGEIGGMGYHVAGQAEFADGEHVVVLARGTKEDGILEVYGLSSGKYTVQDNGSGETVIRNGLGPIVTNAAGKSLSLDEFKSVIERVRNHTTSGEDLGIVVNRDTERDHPQLGFAALIDPNSRPPSGGGIASTTQASPTNSLQDKSVSKREPSSEKSSIGLPEDTWTKLIAIVIVLIAFLLVTVFFVRKPD